MSASLMQMLRGRWFALAVHGGFWLLIYLVIANAGGSYPMWADERSYSLPVEDLVPVGRMGSLFSPVGLLSRAPQGTNDTSMFLTRQFLPAPKPAAPPPTTRKIPVTYLGFYEAGAGSREVILKTPEGFAVVPIGRTVLTNFFVAEAGLQTLLLTNAAAQTNLLRLNTETALEIPLR